LASITTRSNGLSFIQFVVDGKRHTVNIGRLTGDRAARFKANLEALVRAKRYGLDAGDQATAWLHKLDDRIHEALARTGLVPSRHSTDRAGRSLGEFLDSVIVSRTDVKPETARSLRNARARLVKHFGADRIIDTIHPGDADGFLRFLKAQEYADLTVGRTVKYARQFFRVAVRAKLLTENPFEDVKASAAANTKRQFFVTREMAAAVLDACPDYHWRLIFALARYGGLRCPSEHLRLAWTDVDWERNRFLVHAPKTEHHEGKAERWVPIFPELRPFLEEAWERAEVGAVQIIKRTRRSREIYDGMRVILQRAGLKPWPKLFQNLRASCETELAAQFPIHVVCAWIGNSAAIAVKHYLQVTEGDFEKASALQNAQQQGLEQSSTESRECVSSLDIGQSVPDVAGVRDTVQGIGVSQPGNRRHECRGHLPSLLREQRRLRGTPRQEILLRIVRGTLHRQLEVQDDE
jgi:integrase